MKINYTHKFLKKSTHTTHSATFLWGTKANTNDGKEESSQMKTKHLEEQFGKPKEKGSILDGVCRKGCVHPHQFYFVEKKEKINPLKEIHSSTQKNCQDGLPCRFYSNSGAPMLAGSTQPAPTILPQAPYPALLSPSLILQGPATGIFRPDFYSLGPSLNNSLTYHLLFIPHPILGSVKGRSLLQCFQVILKDLKTMSFIQTRSHLSG